MNISQLNPYLSAPYLRGDTDNTAAGQQPASQSANLASGQQHKGGQSAESADAATFEQSTGGSQSSSRGLRQSPESVIIGEVHAMNTDYTVTTGEVSPDDPLSMKRYFYGAALRRARNVTIDRQTLEEMSEDPSFRAEVMSRIRKGMTEAERDSLVPGMKLHASGVIVESGGRTTVWGWRGPDLSDSLQQKDSSPAAQTQTSAPETSEKNASAAAVKTGASSQAATAATTTAATEAAASSDPAQTKQSAQAARSGQTVTSGSKPAAATARPVRASIASVKTATAAAAARNAVRTNAAATGSRSTATRNELWIKRDRSEWEEYDLSRPLQSASALWPVLDIVA